MAFGDFYWPQGLVENPQACVIRFDTNTIACDGKSAMAIPSQSSSLEESYSGFLATVANLNISTPDCRQSEVLSSQLGSLYYERNPYVLVATTPRVTCTFYPKGTNLQPVLVQTATTAPNTTAAPTAPTAPSLASLLAANPVVLVVTAALFVATAQL
jgi:hypothetical protein